MTEQAKEMKVSGRMVLVTLVAFFLVVAAVNAVMATLAIRTFGGLESDNAYKAGLEFSRELNAAREQQARNIAVDISSERLASGKTRFKLTVANLDRATAADLRASIEFRHPADRKHDHSVVLSRSADGSYVGETQIEAGQWNARLSLDHNGERVFRSVNRLVVK